MTANFALLTDTTADLSPALSSKHTIYMIPQVIIWGREELKDGLTISSQQFYERLKTAKEMPTTSRPAPVDIVALMQKAREENNVDEVVILTVSDEVSGTYPASMEAKRMVDFPVHVYDTRTITLALGMTTMKVAEARDAGATPQEALDLAKQLAENSLALFTPGTLEFLRRGGRIGNASHLIGTALSIKPILTLVDGKVEALESVRTRKRALKRLLDLIEEKHDPNKPLHIGVVHGDAQEDMQMVLEEARSRWNPDWLYSGWVSPSIGVHTGPGILGITLVQ